MNLANTLTDICKKQRISFAELSRRSGVPPQTIHNWTLGKRSVNPEQIKKVADVLKVSIHYLLYGEQDPHESPSQEILKEIFSGDVRITLHKIEKSQKGKL